ncbi:pilus assembly PilX family protein [Thiothrix lacustris]|uniref:pilus assembly PilX family protein n=1 Tax=Thiothrix lacustris TaxID=525917 RepID=UPI0027E4BE43|nr:PilX N-terminal domain-containing pilus assembly protein [Thiothrix lacustris]WMP16981.1 PilX N-terminal domain-containing pilus assembly protein [Thiothrix lacustris]
MRTLRKQERGAVLVWGLVILLTMTVIGIAATRMATVDSRIAGNQMMYMLTFQGADSMLRKSSNLYQVMQTATTGETSTSITYDKNKVKTRELKNFGVTGSSLSESSAGVFSDPASQVTVTGVAAMSEEEGCPPLEGIAMTTEMTPDAGGLACRIFTTEAHASLSGTGAKSEHSEGVLKPVPKIN